MKDIELWIMGIWGIESCDIINPFYFAFFDLHLSKSKGSAQNE
jgi:hypothetical protein